MSAATDRLDALVLRALSDGPLTTAALARMLGCAPHAAYDSGFRLVRTGKARRTGDGGVVPFKWEIETSALAPRNDPR